MRTRHLEYCRRGGKVVPAGWRTTLARRIARWNKRRLGMLILRRRDFSKTLPHVLLQSLPLVYNAERPLGFFYRWRLKRNAAQLGGRLLRDARGLLELELGDSVTVRQSDYRVKRILIGRGIVNENGELKDHLLVPPGVALLTRPRRRL